MKSVAVTILSLCALTGCANGGGAQTPAWLAAQEAAMPDSYPSLQSVPRESDVNRDAAYWARLQADVLAAGQAVRSNPRSTPATPADDPNLLLEEARRQIEETRQSHEP